MRSLFTLLVVPAMFLCSASDVNAQSRHISGTVYYADTGQGAEHVFVDLQTAEGLIITTATTSATGDFSFLNLTPQVYQVSVRSQDYEPVSISVDLSFTSVNGQSVVLQKRGTMGKKPAGQSVSAHMLSLPAKARDAYDKGNQDLYQKSDPKAAMGDFEKAVKAAPGFYEAFEGMGWTYAQMGKTSDAEKAFRKSVDISKDSYAPADVGLGAILLDTQRVLEAEKTLTHALELDAKSWRAYYERGRARLMQNNLEDALKDVQQAKALQPKAPSVYRLLAIIHMKQNNGVDLLDDLDSYIQLDPSSPAGQRAKELRDQVAKMVPAKSPTLVSKPATDDAPAPSLRKTGDDQPPNGQSTPASPN